MNSNNLFIEAFFARVDIMGGDATRTTLSCHTYKLHPLLRSYASMEVVQHEMLRRWQEHVCNHFRSFRCVALRWLQLPHCSCKRFNRHRMSLTMDALV